MIREISILDLSDVSNIVGSIDSDAFKRFRLMVTDPSVSVYINEDKTALATYARVNTYLLEAHVDSLKACRGYKLKKFLIDSGKLAVMKDDRITSVINFVDKDNKKLLLFSGTFAKRVGEVGDKIMFVTERERYL